MIFLFKFYLSNSMLHSWETSCPIVFKSIWFDGDPYGSTPTDAMERGNVFETMVIGLSVNQKPTEPSEALKKSTVYERIKHQAKVATAWLNSLGGKILARQEYLQAVVTDAKGRQVPIRGNLDIRYGWRDNPMRQAVIDLKFTGDADNEFGTDFVWGNIEMMDLSQSNHYRILLEQNHPDLFMYEFYYAVFDHSPKKKWKVFKINHSKQSLLNHIERCSKAYHEILHCLETDTWEPISKYSVCKSCKIKCPAEVTQPPIIEVNL